MESDDDKPVGTSRYRGPVFSSEETEDLINLIHKYKKILLNKSSCSSACRVKDACWTKVTKLFNSKGRKHVRTTESLKAKWDNIKNQTRKKTTNIIDVKDDMISPLDARVLSLMHESQGAEYSRNLDFSDEDVDIENEEAEENTGPENRDEEMLNGNDSENPEKQSKYREQTKKRTKNFTVKECMLLLQCVRQEKEIVFSKETNMQLKKEAWKRIANSYNSQSPRSRSTKELHTKFGNMKTLVRKVGFKDYMSKFSTKRNKHEKLVEKKTIIKNEPDFSDDNTREDCDWDGGEDRRHSQTSTEHKPPDPLSSVLNSDSGLGSSGHFGSNYDAEVMKLKLELLNYQIETAKLERKRIEDATAAEAKARETLEVEQAMRLRSARLDAVAAAMRLPPAHPALSYTPEESRAHAYLSQYTAFQPM